MIRAYEWDVQDISTLEHRKDAAVNGNCKCSIFGKK